MPNSPDDGSTFHARLEESELISPWEKHILKQIYNATWVLDHDTFHFMSYFSPCVRQYDIILPNELAWGESHRSEFYVLLQQRLLDWVR